MKRGDLLRHLAEHGCSLAREGSNHSIWKNDQTGAFQPVGRHQEVPDVIARKICRGLGVPEVGR